MIAPVSLHDAVWEIAAPRSESLRLASCWSALVEMFIDGELTATGRIGDPTNDHAPIPREAWPHIRPRDVLWLDPVETVTGRLIFDVSVYQVGVDGPAESGSVPLVAPHSVGSVVAAARWLVDQDRHFEMPDLVGVLGSFGLRLVDNSIVVPIDGDAGAGRPASVGMALATIRAAEIQNSRQGTKAPTAAREAVSWVRERFPGIALPEPRNLARALYRTGDEAEESIGTPEETCG